MTVQGIRRKIIIEDAFLPRTVYLSQQLNNVRLFEGIYLQLMQLSLTPTQKARPPN